MKTTTFRLARRLACLSELREVQRSAMAQAYGAHEWILELDPDELELKELAAARRKLVAKRRSNAAHRPGMADADPLARQHQSHSLASPVGRDADLAELATCLMLLPALRSIGAQSLLAVLHRPQPVIAVHGRIRGFERCFGGLIRNLVRIRDGKLVVHYIDAAEKLLIRYSTRPSELALLNIQSPAFENMEPARLRKCLALAVRERMPIVATTEDARVDLPVRITSTLDLSIHAAPLDWPMLAELIDAKTGIDAQAVIEAASAFPIDLGELGLDDLTLAIRPGRPLDQILARLQDMAAASIAEPKSEETSESSSASSRRRNRNGTAGTGSTRIDPEPILAEPDLAGPTTGIPVGMDRTADGEIHPTQAAASSSDDPASIDTEDPAPTVAPGAPSGDLGTPAAHAPHPRRRPSVLTVETLSGYGDAQRWAMNLKSDVALWQEGRIPWSDLSTKLLLSGPPGTGKTIFAKALGNSLQLPVFATSVATWLEASHLGDVLGRMRDCFSEAMAARPCILFIDEIDGIGRRQDQQREYADYWNSIVNKALELMDGAVRSDGIIILGATNRPDDIEPALRRSGRLETHIRIGKPDMHALEGIIAFHLADDLEAVVASVPSPLRPDPSRRDEDGHQDKMSQSAADTKAAPDPEPPRDACKPRQRRRSIAERKDVEKDEVKLRPSDGERAAASMADRGSDVKASASEVPIAHPGPSLVTVGGLPHRYALRLLARSARGMTGADIERVVRQERQRCRRNATSMSFNGVHDALRGDRPQLSNALRRQLAVHEAGHAVVSRVLKLGQQHDLTIDDPEGGRSELAVDMRDIQSEARLTDLITMHLAGRAAELTCGLEPLAGAGFVETSDLHVATRLALDLECRAGFSQRSPLLYVDPDTPNALYAARPDAYQRADKRLEDAMATAREIVAAHLDAHTALVEQLATFGTLDGQEVDAVLARYIDPSDRKPDP